MTERTEEPTDRQSQLDRLVDGELSEAECRRMLASLDDQPDGWRQCALAFLEAQAWRLELPAMVRRHKPAAVPAPAKRFSRKARFGWALAMAAGVLMAFGLGVWYRASRVPDPAVQTAEEVSSPDRGPAAPERAEQAPQLADAPRSENSAGRPLENVTLVVDGAGGSRRIELPVVEMDRIDDQWYRQQASAVPPEVLETLENAGHRIRRHQRFVRLPLEDGRRVVLPMEEFEIVPVSGGAYQ